MQDSQARPAPRPGVGTVLALAGVLALAAALRLWRIGHGLPDFLEEAIPYKEALEMWGGGGATDLNPRFYNYPSLVLYLQFAVQKLHYLLGSYQGAADWLLAQRIDPTGSVVAGRMVNVLADLATIVAVWRLGRRRYPGAGLLAAAICAVATPMVLTARLIFVEPVMAALALWSLERMDAHVNGGGRGSLAAAAVLAGLAAGAKYNAGLLMLPLAYTLWARGGWRGLRAFPLWAAVSVASFLATSPFILVDFGRFWHHFSYEREHMATGHLGTGGELGAGFVLGTLGRTISWPALMLLVMGLGRLAWRRGRASFPGEALLWWALLPVLASVLLFRMNAMRYLAPVVPLLALVVVMVGWRLVDDLRGRSVNRNAVAAALAVVLLLPAAWQGATAAFAGAEATQILARRWLEANIDPTDTVLQEQYGADMRSRLEIERLTREPIYAAASQERRDQVDAWTRWHVVTMPLLVSGQLDVRVAEEGGAPASFVVFPRAIDFNQVFYHPGMLAGMDWFVTSSAVAGRFAADDPAFAAQHAFYAWLAANADTAAVFAPGGDVSGPAVTILRLPPEVADAGETAPRLPLDWWREAVPPDFPAQAAARSASIGLSPENLTVPVDPRLPPWSHYLRPLFNRYLAGFLLDQAMFHFEAGRPAAALPKAQAVHAMLPDDVFGARFMAMVLGATGRGDEALAVLRRTAAFQARGSPQASQLSMVQARLLGLIGRTDEAAALLDTLLTELPPGAPDRREATELLRRWRPDGR